MDRELFAQITLTAYAAIAIALVGWQTVRSGQPWRACALFVLARVYMPFVFHWRANSRCPFPTEGGGLIIANHRSPIDPIVLWTNHHFGRSGNTGFRIISFIMAREYYEQPWLKWGFKLMQSIPVERDGEDSVPLKTALRYLREGKLLAVFPEGRINLEDQRVLLPGDPGVAWLALRAQVPVYPVFIEDAPGGDHMLQPFYTPARVRVNYGAPIDLSQYHGKRYTHSVLTHVTDELMEALAALGKAKHTPIEANERTVKIPIRPASAS